MRRFPAHLHRPLSRLRRPLPALLLVTVAALIARLWALGWRVAHQDEGRVAAWILHYMEYGEWQYRAVIHGPFLPHVDGVVFSVLGANDFTMRLVVAVFGALLPLSALLFRARLRDTEMVALGAFLAANPLLLYYSRFMRNDLLLAGFMFVAFGFFVRAADTGRRRHLFLGTACFALGFTTKENALLFPVTWLGAAVLLLDHRLLADVTRGRSGWVAVRDRLGGVFRTVFSRRWGPALLLAVAEFVGIFLLFYAPKPDLWNAFGDPTLFPGVLEDATVGVYDEFHGMWIEGSTESPYVPYFAAFGKVLWASSIPMIGLGVFGFLWDRFAGERPRDVVAFASYWAGASMVGYPIAADNAFPWEMVQVAVPLALPAGVGLALVYRMGRDAVSAREAPEVAGVALLLLVEAWSVLVLAENGLDAALAGDPATLLAVVMLGGLAAALFASGADAGLADRLPTDNQVLAGATAALLVVVAAQVGAVAYDTSYANPQSVDNELVQYAQPAGEMQGTLAQIRRLAAEHEGVDVLWAGDEDPDGCDELLYQETETWARGQAAPCGWFSRLPLPWYMSAYGVESASVKDVSEISDTPPPVVIALQSGARGNPDLTAEDVALRLDGYEQRVYQQYQYGRPLVFFVDEDRVPSDAGA